MYNINSPQFALAPQPPDTHNPGEVKQYGKDWFSGNAPNAILGPDSDWTHAMQNSTAMAIDRVRAREMLDNFCKPLNGAHFPRIFGEFSGWVGLEGERAFRMKAVGVG
jgi:hypothetical protein